MGSDFLTEHSVFFNASRLAGIAVFLGGGLISLYLWHGLHFRQWNVKFFMTNLLVQRKEILKTFFVEGPGYLLLPLLLVLAAGVELVFEQMF